MFPVSEENKDSFKNTNNHAKQQQDTKRLH